MKSIIIDGFENFDVDTICNKAPFDKVFYIGHKNTVAENLKIKTYDCFEIPFGRYPDDYMESEPLDEQIINKFVDCESIVMKMFERNDFWFQASYNQRKEWYLMHLRYWYYNIYKYNVVCFVKVNFPHEVYDYIIYSIVNDKNAKSFFFHQMVFMNRYFLEEDIYSYPRLDTYLKSNRDYKEPNAEVRDYLSTKRADAKKTNDVFQVIEKQRGLVKKQHKIIDIYNKKYASNPDLNKRFFFVALHFQPENTTSPMAKQFVYQDLMIDMLDYYLPKDVFIYIKEHPAQTTVCRSVDFYKKYYNNKRIKFIKTDINSRVLIDKSLAVVTCTGTVGWESLIRYKPVIIFGNFFYQFAPGCFPVKTKQDLILCIEKIMSGFCVDKKEIDSFFQKIYEYSYYGYIDTRLAQFVSLSEKENTGNIHDIFDSVIFDNYK